MLSSDFADMESIHPTTPLTGHDQSSHIRLVYIRRCSSSMAEMIIDHVASLKVPYHLYANQLSQFSPRHPNPIVLSGSLRGSPSASLIIQ